MMNLYDKDVISIETDTTVYAANAPTVIKVQCIFSGDGDVLYCLVHFSDQITLINNSIINKITFKK